MFKQSSYVLALFLGSTEAVQFKGYYDNADSPPPGYVLPSPYEEERGDRYEQDGSMHWDKVDPWVYEHAAPVVDVSWTRTNVAPDRCSYTPPPPECDKEMTPMAVVEPGIWIPPELDPNFGMGAFAQQTLRARDQSIFDEYERQNDQNNNMNALRSLFSWQQQRPEVGYGDDYSQSFQSQQPDYDFYNFMERREPTVTPYDKATETIYPPKDATHPSYYDGKYEKPSLIQRAKSLRDSPPWEEYQATIPQIQGQPLGRKLSSPARDSYTPPQGDVPNPSAWTKPYQLSSRRHHNKHYRKQGDISENNIDEEVQQFADPHTEYPNWSRTENQFIPNGSKNPQAATKELLQQYSLHNWKKYENHP